MKALRTALVVLCLGALALPPPGIAAEGGGARNNATGARKDKMTKRPRDQADLTGGEILQLETMWLPVAARGRGRQYYGMTVQLMPAPDKLPEACYKAPWVNEALVFYFNEHPLTGSDQATLDQGPLLRALRAVVDTVAGPGIFKGIKLIDRAVDLTNESDAELSLICS